MNSTFLATVLAASALCGAVAAAGPAATNTGLGQRERVLAAFEQLPTPRLETVFMECDRTASVRLMALDEGALCAMAWDALLRRGFNGDVTALLAWWRAQRQQQSPESPTWVP